MPNTFKTCCVSVCFVSEFFGPKVTPRRLQRAPRRPERAPRSLRPAPKNAPRRPQNDPMMGDEKIPIPLLTGPLLGHVLTRISK